MLRQCPKEQAGNCVGEKQKKIISSLTTYILYKGSRKVIHVRNSSSKYLGRGKNCASEINLLVKSRLVSRFMLKLLALVETNIFPFSL